MTSPLPGQRVRCVCGRTMTVAEAMSHLHIGGFPIWTPEAVSS